MNGDRAPAAARVVGRYEILRRIGKGGMATVYLARQPDLDRDVALKELERVEAAEQPVFVSRFLHEARLAGSLNHPNLVSVIEYFEHAGRPYIAMEYAEGGSLRRYLADLTLAQIAGVLEGLLAGLSHAEGHGIVHCDIKPENILVTGEGRIKITDFGIAHAYNAALSESLESGEAMTVGTPRYMAPEQATGSRLSAATDLYSIGVVGYEMLVGQVPFGSGETPLTIVHQHVHDRVPDPRQLRPELDPRLAGWLEHLLAKDPADRPVSAAAAWDGLEEVVLDLLGARWRRAARLAAPKVSAEASSPLTPAASGPVVERADPSTPIRRLGERLRRAHPAHSPGRPGAPEDSERPEVAPRGSGDHTVAYRRDRPAEAARPPSARPAGPSYTRIAAWTLAVAAALIAVVAGIGLWVASERRGENAVEHDLQALRLTSATVRAAAKTGSLVQRMAAIGDPMDLGMLVPDLDRSISEVGGLKRGTLRTLPKGDAARRDLVRAQLLAVQTAAALRVVAEARGAAGTANAVASARAAYTRMLSLLEATTRLIRRRLSRAGQLDPADSNQLDEIADDVAAGKSRVDPLFRALLRGVAPDGA